MSTASLLIHALHAWTHVVMQRSMSDFMRYARGAGLSMQQFGVLFYLHRTGTGRAVSDIGEDLGVTSAAASQMIERLVQQHLLDRSEDPHDRRSKQVVLTPQAQDLIEESKRARLSWMQGLCKVLTPAQQKDVTAALKLLNAAAQSLESQDQAPDRSEANCTQPPA